MYYQSHINVLIIMLFNKYSSLLFLNYLQKGCTAQKLLKEFSSRSWNKQFSEAAKNTDTADTEKTMCTFGR